MKSKIAQSYVQVKMIFAKSQVLMLSLLFLSRIVVSQNQITVLIPTINDNREMVFDLSNLTKKQNLTIRDVQLKIPQLSYNNLEKDRTCQVYLEQLDKDQNSDRWSKLGSLGITRSSENIGFSIEKEEHIDFFRKDSVVLRLRQAKSCSENAITFFSGKYEINVKPRLVIDYEVKNDHSKADWEQDHGNAQHTNSTIWQHNYITTELAESAQYKGKSKNEIIGIYNGHPITLSKENTDQFVIQYLNNSSKDGDRKLELEIPNIDHSFVNENGILFCFSDSSSFQVIDLVTRQSTVGLLSAIKVTANDSIRALSNAPTLGDDDSIYLPIKNDNGRIGIVALSTYPSLAPRWVYNTEKPIGPATLSKDSRWVFFIESVKVDGEVKSKLVVLDNITGRVAQESDLILGSYMNNRNSNLPFVTVQSIQKGNVHYAYVADEYQNSKKMFVFEVQTTGNTIMDGLKSMSNKNIIESTYPMSYPAVANNDVYMVKDGFLLKYNPMEGAFGFNPRYDGGAYKPGYYSKTLSGTAMRRKIDNPKFLYVYGGVIPNIIVINKPENNAGDSKTDDSEIFLFTGNDLPAFRFYDYRLISDDRIFPANSGSFFYSSGSAIYNVFPKSYYYRSEKDRTSEYLSDHFSLNSIMNTTSYRYGKTLSIEKQNVSSGTNANITAKRINIEKGFTVEKGVKLKMNIN